MNTNTLTKLYTKYKQNGREIIPDGGIAASFNIDLVSQLPFSIIIMTESITAINLMEKKYDT